VLSGSFPPQHGTSWEFYWGVDHKGALTNV
jgi:hypothetical protein